MSSTLTLSKTRVSPPQRSSQQLMTLEADKAAHKYVTHPSKPTSAMRPKNHSFPFEFFALLAPLAPSRIRLSLANSFLLSSFSYHPIPVVFARGEGTE